MVTKPQDPAPVVKPAPGRASAIAEGKRPAPGSIGPLVRGDEGAGFASILACVDGARHSAHVLDWAVALSRGLGAELHLLHVLDTSAAPGTPQHPLAWDMRRMEAVGRMQALMAQSGHPADLDDAAVEVMIGPLHERIRARLAEGSVDLCVIGATGERNWPVGVIGATARRIIETSPCSVLVVPQCADDEAARLRHGGLARVMVPLDCSPRAETALPIAAALAQAFGAEIVIAHAVPQPPIVTSGSPDDGDIALGRNLTERNRKAAEGYLGRIRLRLATERRPIRTLIVNGDEPRHRLVRAVREEGVDMIVLSAKGAGGYADEALGSVANFLVTHLDRPLLIVRPGPCGGRRAAAGHEDEVPVESETSVKVGIGPGGRG